VLIAFEGALSEWEWGITREVSGRGSLGELSYQFHPGSGLSASWPFVILQDEQRAIQGFTWTGSWATWGDITTDPSVYEGSSLNLVPTPTYQNMSGVSILYQSDTSLIEYQVYPNSTAESKYICKRLWSSFSPITQTVSSMGRQLYNGTLTDSPLPATGLTQSIPYNSSVAAFSFNSSSTTTFTCVLYQDSSMTVQMLWQILPSTTWNGPKTFDAFKGADNGTGIACTTMNSYYSGLVTRGRFVPRCYFQADGFVREVEMVGVAKDWSTVGNVSLK
jgi:hypothetical protein